MLSVDGRLTEVGISKWKGFRGQHYAQVVIPDSMRYKTVAINNPFVRKDDIAWFATHYHTPQGNMAYQFSYIYKYRIPIEPGSTHITLPDNPAIKIISATTALDGDRQAVNLFPVYDDFTDHPMFR